MWEEYQSGIPEWRRTAAQEGDIWADRRTLHTNLPKAASSALTQLRTEKTGLAYFLYRQRVPGVNSPGCEDCGWRKQDVKHVFMFCPRYQERRQLLINRAGTNDLYKMLTTQKGAEAIA